MGEHGPSNESREESKENMSMKRFILGAALVLSTMSIGASAFAEDKVVQESDKTVYKKKTIIDFSDVTIQGELTKPEGSYVLNRKKTSFKSLLKIRANFLPELFNSTDNL
jgi:hypothetical protein